MSDKHPRAQFTTRKHFRSTCLKNATEKRTKYMRGRTGDARGISTDTQAMKPQRPHNAIYHIHQSQAFLPLLFTPPSPQRRNALNARQNAGRSSSKPCTAQNSTAKKRYAASRSSTHDPLNSPSQPPSAAPSHPISRQSSPDSKSCCVHAPRAGAFPHSRAVPGT